MNHRKSRNCERAKMRLTCKGERTNQKVWREKKGQVVYLSNLTDEPSPGLKMAPKPETIIFHIEHGNPNVLLAIGTDLARGRDGTVGVGGGKKRMPSCNVMDSPYG